MKPKNILNEWDDEETAELARMMALGMRPRDMAIHLPGRSVASIDGKARKLRELAERRNPPAPTAMPPAVNRDPCLQCGVRQDIGCKHTAAAEQAIERNMKKIGAAVVRPVAPVPPSPPGRRVGRQLPAPGRRMAPYEPLTPAVAVKVVSTPGVEAEPGPGDLTTVPFKPDPSPATKPRISTRVYRAWQEDGRPFHDFLTAMIELGVDEWERFRSERVAAE